MLVIQKRTFSAMFGFLNVWLLIFCLLIVTSCKNIKEKNNGRLLASVGEKQLFDGDLPVNLYGNKDSTQIKERLVKDWVKKQLVFNKALAVLTDKEKDKDKQLKDYYESLISYEYFNKITSAKTDTAVSENEMREYFNANQKNFQTKSNIVRLLYVKVPEGNSDLKNIKNWVKHMDNKSGPVLKLYTSKYNIKASLDTVKWWKVSDISREVPLDESQANLVHGYLEKRDGSYVYEFNIIDHKSPGETEPYILERDKIRQIILNQRKSGLIRDTENMIYREAETGKLFEIYGDKTIK